MSHGFLPRTDPALLAWARHFIAVAGPEPESFGLSELQLVEFSAATESFADGLRLCSPNIRNKVAVATKNAQRESLKILARSLNNFVQGDRNVSDAQKVRLGLSVRGARATTPAPASAPALMIRSVRQHIVSVSLQQAGTDTGLRGRPRNVSGALVFSAAGEHAPTSLGEWKFETLVSKAKFDVTFPATLPPGTRIWLTAMWFSHRKETGPACAPVGTNLQGGGVEVSALRLAA
jgi:hypothetical protein